MGIVSCRHVTQSWDASAMTEIRVTVSRWQTRGPWWRGYRRMPGLELEINGYGTTQTYGTRDLDTARAMVLDYLDCVDAPARRDAAITWTDTGA